MKEIQTFENFTNRITPTGSSKEKFKESREYLKFCQLIKESFPDAEFTKGEVNFEAKIGDGEIGYDKVNDVYLYIDLTNAIVKDKLTEVISELQEIKEKARKNNTIENFSRADIDILNHGIEYQKFQREISEKLPQFNSFSESQEGYTSYTNDGTIVINYLKNNSEYKFQLYIDNQFNNYNSIQEIADYLKSNSFTEGN